MRFTMFFYKISAMIEKEKWIEENNDRRVQEKRQAEIAVKSEEFNRKDGGNRFFFVSTIGYRITCGVISLTSDGIIKKAREFFKAIRC